MAARWEANAEIWTRQVRAGYDVYRDALNLPAFLDMLPPVTGLCGLDLGCGEGSITRCLARLGTQMHAIDIAPTFIRNAQTEEETSPLGIVYEQADAAALPFGDACFDFVTAFMSLMDMPDQGQVLEEAQRVLRPGGFLQFSVLHPCFAPRHRKVQRDVEGTVTAIEVGGYFGPEDCYLETWWFPTLPMEERGQVEPFRIPVFHHTLSEWVEMICAAGLTIDQFGEPSASPELARAEPMLADTKVAPLFLHVRARKPLTARFSDLPAT